MSVWRRVLAERRLVVLSLGVALLANVAVLALGVLPLRQSVVGDKQAAEQATFDLAQARRLERGAQAARDSRDQADKELRKFYGEVLPRSESDARHIAQDELQRLAAESGLTFENDTMDAQSIKDSQLTKLKTTATFTGGYPNIRRFLYAVETAPSFLAVEDVLLEQPTARQGTTGSLRVTLHIATYYLR